MPTAHSAGLPRAGSRWGRLGLGLGVFALLLVGCGDDNEATGGTSAGRWLGTFTATPGGGARQNNVDGGLLELVVGAGGQVTLTAVTVRASEPIVAVGTVDADGGVGTLTDTADGSTISFTGTVGGPSASGTWTATGGSGENASGTWTAAPAPAQHPFAGDGVGSYTFQEVENQRTGTMDFTVDTQGRVTAWTFNPDPANGGARQAAGVSGFVDPLTGRIAAVAPFPASAGTPVGSVATLGGTLSDDGLTPAAMRVWPPQGNRYFGNWSIPLLAQIAVISGIIASGEKRYTADAQQTGSLTVAGDGAVFNQGELRVGDTSSNGSIQAFLTFDLSGQALPRLHDLRAATVRLVPTSVEGDPFTGREFFAERVEYQGSPMQFGSGPRPAGTALIDMNAHSGETLIDVAELLREALEEGDTKLQLRLRYQPAHDTDNARDVFHFTLGQLVVQNYPERPTYP